MSLKRFFTHPCWRKSDLDEDPGSMVHSYLFFRTMIGVIGIGLPILLAVGGLLWGGESGIRPSISGYYHNDLMRDHFVGAMFVLAAVLLFVVFIVFAGVFFPRTKHTWKRPWFRWSAVIMSLSIIGMVVVHRGFNHLVGTTTWIFWLETIALVAFGVSWFVKGWGYWALVGKSFRSMLGRTET